ncbi:hypothetical protein SEA_BIRCHLYN_260 [Streptomyces phage Birchlyn]|nr:hypothetical protein SEA_BIRCHLYN_260 [Streptomyces phage Birchlyn]
MTSRRSAYSSVYYHLTSVSQQGCQHACVRFSHCFKWLMCLTMPSLLQSHMKASDYSVCLTTLSYMVMSYESYMYEGTLATGLFLTKNLAN